MKKFFIAVSAWSYKRVLKPLFFRFDPEKIHNFILTFGEFLGKVPLLKWLIGSAWKVESPALHQTIAGISFPNPVGLAAGFDYKAKLTAILPAAGFGFETIGTITNDPYEGNPGKRLGRLVESKSLLVNKGFKNEGIKEILAKLQNEKFEMPIGISIGATNREYSSREDAIKDILSAFRAVEAFHIPLAYYELNISCPNLKTEVSFYPPECLKELLSSVFSLNLSRPLFIKMPINEPDEDVKEMLSVVSHFPVAGVIFGNLQKDRNHPSLHRHEVEKHGPGNFSGKPTEARSNELISLAYKHYGKKFVIIGTGGIMSPKDAYKKIKLGASLVQLITGLVFEGPQLVAEINLALPELLAKDGFKNISEAVGADTK